MLRDTNTMSSIAEQLAQLGIGGEAAAGLLSQLNENNHNNDDSKQGDSSEEEEDCKLPPAPPANNGLQQHQNETKQPTFALGEDAPAMTGARMEQEEKWKNSQVNVRQQLSNREALLSKNIRNQMRRSIQDFHAIHMLMRVMSKLPPEVG